MKGIVVLGATGSIGVSTLDVINQHPEHFKVIALSAHSNHQLLFKQCVQFQPQYAVLEDPIAAAELRLNLASSQIKTDVLCDQSALIDIVQLPQVDMVMAAIMGAAGLMPTLAAVRAGKRILLANKETLVMAGDLFMAEARRHQATILPIDSEHNAVFQCFPANFKLGQQPAGVNKIILTASGGAFRDLPLEQLSQVTPQQACTHPNWQMGKKITVDSATMMNKGLEVIEAYYLFGLPVDKIEVLLHPQSIVHSLVEYADGSMLAQLGNPDMRTPIAYALAWPERIHSGVSTLDLINLGRLDFSLLDPKRYPCLDLAYQAIKAGGTAPTILNAANEIAVEAFLKGKIRFTEIYQIVAEMFQRLPTQSVTDIAEIVSVDNKARQFASVLIRNS